MFSNNPSVTNEQNETSNGGESPSADLAWLSPLIRQLVIILLGSSSLILALFSFFQGESPSAFLIGNKLPIASRTAALSATWFGGMIVSAGSFLWARKSRDPKRASQDIAKVAAPFIPSAFAPVLFEADAWRNAEIGFFAFLLAFGLALERTSGPAFEVLGRRLQESTWANKLQPIVGHSAWKFVPPALVTTLILSYLFRIGHATTISHMRLQTHSSDLAEYDNLFYNALIGHPFRSPAVAGYLEDWSNLQNHAELGVYLLLPFYAIAPGAKALLWIQTTFVALTAAPLYLVAAQRRSRIAGLCIVVVYFFMPAVQQPNFYDFHFTPVGMCEVAWMMYFASRLADAPRERKFRIGMFVCMGAALLCREDTSIGITVLGVFLVLSGALVKDGLIIAGVAAIYFVSMKFLIMPMFGTWWFDTMYNDLKAEGAKGFGAVILTLISNPSFVLRQLLIEPKLLYVLNIIVPVLALWLRRPLYWMAILPAFVATLLVTNRPPMYEPTFQYTYLWMPYVMMASILALRKGFRGKGTLLALVVCAMALTNKYGVFPTGDTIDGGFGMKKITMGDAEIKQYQDLKDIIQMMPKDAVVAATEFEGPHVSNRPVMYSLKKTLGPWPEYLLVGRPGLRGELGHLKKALESQKYGVIAEKGRFTLAKLGADPSKNDRLWKKARARPPGARARRKGHKKSGRKPRESGPDRSRAPSE